MTDPKSSPTVPRLAETERPILVGEKREVQLLNDGPWISCTVVRLFGGSWIVKLDDDAVGRSYYDYRAGDEVHVYPHQIRMPPE